MQDFREKMESIVEQLAPEGQVGAKQDLDRLWQLGVETYDDLLAVAGGDGDVRSREIACWYVARLGDARAFTTLARCLDADDVDLRSQAARCLGILGGDEAGARLVRCLEVETDPDVRMYAAHSLGMVPHPRAFEALRSILHQPHEEPRVRGMAAESLGYLHDRRAIADLVSVLDDPSPELRYWAVFALGQLGDASLIPKLQRLLEDHECAPGLGSVADEVAETIELLKRSANRGG